ncbi:MAG TPA: YceI family protein [Steroidobacteraceae bacterium]|jgi:polyisoprenoid-binding protein YceI
MIRILLLALAAMISSAVQAAPATYRIDPEHFSIAFLIEHVGYEKVIGQFLKGEGEFVYDEAAKTLQSGHVAVRADSVFSNHDKRDAHVRSGDFLDAKAHPLVNFVAKSYRAEGESGGVLSGDLTMLGQTHPVELKIKLNKAATYPFGHRQYTLGVSARATIQRSLWGMSYGVKNGLVGDDVELLFEFEALRQGS